jgi:hypothetical protein
MYRCNLLRVILTRYTGLPAGSYTAVISTFGKTAIAQTFSVAPSATTNLGAIFENLHQQGRTGAPWRISSSRHR